MKKYHSMMAMLALMVAAFGFVACGSDDDEYENGSEKTSSSLTVITSSGDKYILLTEKDGYEDNIGNLTNSGTIWCFLRKENTSNTVYLHIYLDKEGMTIKDFPNGHDLGQPTLNFGLLRTYTNEYDYLSGSIMVIQNNDNSFVLDFKNYSAQNESGKRITINGKLKVVNEVYY